MRRALELATLGRGHVSPNPMVGCVIVHDAMQRILGEGWHQRYGEAHAEPLVAAPFLALHYMVYRLMLRSDEFLRMVIAKRLIVTTLLVMPGTLAYGLTQSFVHAPVISITFVAPIFWVVYAIVCLFVKGSQVPTSE